MKFNDLLFQYSRDDFVGFSSFIREAFHDHYILLNETFLCWQYKNNLQNKLSVDLIKIDKKVMGYLGHIPIDLAIHGKSYQSKCLANLMIHPDLRPLGMGAVLLKNVEKSTKVLYVSGYNSDVQKVYDQLGWVTDIYLRRYIYVLDGEKVSRLAEAKIFKSNQINEKKTDNYVFQQVKDLPSGYEKFWHRIKKKYKITINRTSDYMRWRYINHPILKYDLVAVTKNEILLAVAVIRVEIADNAKILRIIDLISEDEVESFLFNSLAEYARLKNAAMIDFFFSGDYYLSTLKKCGFRDSSKDKNDAEIPILLNPVSKKKKYINLAYKIIDENLSSVFSQNLNNWYVTKGDGDQDRPN